MPSLGRFLTPDPILGGSANPYDYANQDPINLFDLTGECANPGHGKCYGPPTPAWAKKAARAGNRTGKLRIKTGSAQRFLALLNRPLLLEKMIRKVRKWEAEDVLALKRQARETPEQGDPESLCDSASKVGNVLEGAGFISSVVPGGQGIAVAIGVPGLGLTITTWIAC